MPLKYKKSVVKSTNISLNKDILQSEESVPNLRKEISRVFHMANRRIQNIESKNYISPALTALNLEDTTDKFSKFSLSGKTWNELKIEYAKAVEFLRKPTSTASGARQYEQHLQTEFNLTNEQLNIVRNKINNKHISEQENQFVENYLFKYKDFDIVFENAVNDVSTQLETAAQKLENLNDFGKSIERDLSKNYMDMNGTDLKNILDNLKDLGF